mmetsp:Transcript_47321/g.34611  ORF Transcript_47321/g.34611 Transcript_47321/m.34611 type:complete len:126 (-) Transcript_47321:28-405(-)
MEKLREIRVYLENVINKRYRYNPQIIHNLQDIFNLLPNLKIEEVVQSFTSKNNEQMHMVYVASLIKSVITLHNLINNKINTKEIEAEQHRKEEEMRKKKEEEVRKKVEDALAKANIDNEGSKEAK